eukprot:4643461-Prymnesium_polylepis.1
MDHFERRAIWRPPFATSPMCPRSSSQRSFRIRNVEARFVKVSGGAAGREAEDATKGSGGHAPKRG